MDPAWIAFGALVVMALVYFASKKGRADSYAERRQEDLVAAKVETYSELVRSHHSSGIHALGTLGLDELDSDERIRDAIERMKARSGKDPLGKKTRPLLEGVDLWRFFRHVAERAIDFNKTSVPEVLASMSVSDALDSLVDSSPEEFLLPGETPGLVAGAILLGVTTRVIPGALVLYGIWLGFKAHFFWGLMLMFTFPIQPVIGLTEVLFGWTWMSPLWPFTLALGIWAVVMGIAVGLTALYSKVKS